jgi:endonuclease-8
MSEGPEVKIVADKISSVLKGKEIEDIMSKNLDSDTKNKIIGSKLEYVKTFGKNLVFKFSSGVYLRNHMMMWGKWRIYDRSKYDKGLARSPPKKSKVNNYSLLIKSEKDVRNDSLVRLTIITKEKVLIEFNGPILQFSIDNLAEKEPIKSLGPDCLNHQVFDKEEVKKRLLLHSKQKELLISEALLNQKIIAGIGNKYKSEVLFICKINPFKQISQLDTIEQNHLFEEIPKLLRYGYKNLGRSRPLSKCEKHSWNTKHWVFRRAGRECWICKTKILSEKN